MNLMRFARLNRALTCILSRRALVRVHSGSLLGLAAARLPGEAKARKKKRTKRKRRLVLNTFGCVSVRGRCRGDDANCCSGRCIGRKPKPGEKDSSRCAGHDANICKLGQDTCAGEFIPCPNSSSPFARCVITTGEAPYCAGDVICQKCARDGDCSEEFGSGSACIVCGDCPEETACATLETLA